MWREKQQDAKSNYPRMTDMLRIRPVRVRHCVGRHIVRCPPSPGSIPREGFSVKMKPLTLQIGAPRNSRKRSEKSKPHNFSDTRPETISRPERNEKAAPTKYRDGKKGWYVVARNLFLLLLNNSGQDQAAVA